MRREDLVTEERQLRMLEEVLRVYRDRGQGLQHELRRVVLHDLIATQSSIEAPKFPVVLEMVREGHLDVPVIVEEHFRDDRLLHYLVDGHCRTRALIELGRRRTEAYVIWSPAGDFPSNLVAAAETYGNVLVRDLPIR